MSVNGFIKASIKVTGIVQGVGFRFYVERMAEILNITGWVKNEWDGSVFVLAVGTEESVRDFIITLEKGPTFSRVDNVEVKIENVDFNDYPDFKVKF